MVPLPQTSSQGYTQSITQGTGFPMVLRIGLVLQTALLYRNSISNKGTTAG